MIESCLSKVKESDESYEAKNLDSDRFHSIIETDLKRRERKKRDEN